ncbi:molecular chaperone DnaK, partial [Staphylococcus pseudintermedius]
EEDKKEAEAKKDELKTALEGSDIEDIKAKKEALEQVVQQLSMKVYEQAQQAAQQGGENTSQNDSTVEDAEFKEVNDDDNQQK